uniref:Uncharacterized protein n=1 Tax=Tetranychus urticae TaxID=32264 RepID=T1KK36_TETUR
MVINGVSSKLVTLKKPLANTSDVPSHGYLKMASFPGHQLRPQFNHQSQSPLALHPSPISAQLPVGSSLSPDLYWIPTLGNGVVVDGHRREGFFGKIRSFFNELRVDPSRAFINTFDGFLGRLGDAIFHALVEIILDFILGFNRG